MRFMLDAQAVEQVKSDCVVIGIPKDQKLSGSAARLDKQCHGYISKLLKNGDFSCQLGATLLLCDIPKLKIPRLLLVGYGDINKTPEMGFVTAAQAATKALLQTKIKDAHFCLTECDVNKRPLLWKVGILVRECYAATYQFTQLKSNNQKPPAELNKITIVIDDAKQVKAAKDVVENYAAIAKGIELAKNLANLPANYCTPTYLGEQAIILSKQYKKLKVTVLDEKEIKKLGMGSFLSVTAGSRQPPRLICLEYQGGAKKAQPVTLVGKGITFDTGGISLKPASDMDFMKYDMCGAASVLGAFKAACEIELPINIVGIIPTCENMPGGKATKPGDIVTSMAKLTIEVLNTDAEGRLILCDALTYAQRFNPALVLDVATLTGAMAISLGTVACGFFTADEELAENLLTAGQQSFDRTWRMPLWDDYQDALDSNFADIANVGDRYAGSITAACFLSRFTKDYRWAHLDIAGIAYKSGKEKGATGRPVSLLTQFLINYSNQK